MQPHQILLPGFACRSEFCTMRAGSCSVPLKRCASSTENERHSVVLRKDNKEVLVKQIAGAVAKRIVNYLEVGQKVRQTEEMGFIKFGSRVDLLLPLGTTVNVQLNQVVQGGVTVIATF